MCVMRRLQHSKKLSYVKCENNFIQAIERVRYENRNDLKSEI